MDDELQLTDKQYLQVLKKIKATVAQDDFGVVCYDCTVVGCRSVGSNCGFCNDDYTDRGTALFPDRFPERKTMKYRGEKHKCPFDMRRTPGILGWGYSCFYECYLFKHLDKRGWKLSSMCVMVDRAIEVAG